MLSDMNLSKDNIHASASFNSEYDERNNHTDADNVAILGTNEDKFLPTEFMSTKRRCCFIASLLLCVFAVVSFVWVIPCDESAACPARVDRVKTHNWLNNYTTIELKGGVHVVSGLRSWEKNLIFLYRGDALFPELDRKTAKRNGIISLVGSSGAVAWYKEIFDEQIAIDCNSLDVDANGNLDCLILDEHGQLGAINPVSGQWFWRYLERSTYKFSAEDFPLVLPDLDDDGVLELLIVSSANVEQRLKSSLRKGDVIKMKKERNTLRILSGRSGKPFGSDFRLHDCDIIRRLYLEKAQTISFVCIYNQTETQRFKTIGELLALITNKSTVVQKLNGAIPPRTQHRKSGIQRNIYSLSGRELLVENNGHCPEDCSVTIMLTEIQNGKILRNFTKAAMYGMTPVPWSFKSSGKQTSGFVMKFWKWNIDAKNVTNTTTSSDTKAREDNMPIVQDTDSKLKMHTSKNANKAHVSKGYSFMKNSTVSSKLNQTHSNKTDKHGSRHERSTFKRQQHTANEFNDFDKLIELRHTYSIADETVRVTRSVGTTNITKQNKLVGGDLLQHNYKMQLITESVILVLFIGADTRIENTSQSNIVQFCRRRSNYSDRNEILCQPDLNNQDDSILIADLDQDGSQEFISYMSTYVSSDTNSTAENWDLVTYVRLLRLQAELPILYDAQNHN